MNKVDTLTSHLHKIMDLKSASSVLQWDEEVYLPEKGLNARGEQIATLNSFAHELFISDATKTLIHDALAGSDVYDDDSDEKRLLKIVKRDFEQSSKIPPEIVSEQSRLAAQSFHAWRNARSTDNFSQFEPWLHKTVELNRKIADLLGYSEHPYDALIDIYEPEMKFSTFERLFGKMKEELSPIYAKIVSSAVIDDSFLNNKYDIDTQWDFSMEMLRKIGFDFTRGRQDKSTHPFTTTFSVDDVRVTNRFSETLPISSIFSAIHEGGHALYEQGVDTKFDRTYLMGGATLGLHESQSRLWENIIGRSYSFWKNIYPLYQSYFPEQLKTVTIDQFYRAINRVVPGPIRVEADEVSYNFHIFIRFEIESLLIGGNLSVGEIPEYWNGKYKEYLGIVPKNNAEGCLQDIHWAHGSFGYFPTYSLGNIIAAQLFAKISEDIPHIALQIQNGDFSAILEWLRMKVHIHGRKFFSAELVKKITGTEIDSCYFSDYLNRKYSKIYNF